MVNSRPLLVKVVRQEHTAEQQGKPGKIVGIFREVRSSSIFYLC